MAKLLYQGHGSYRITTQNRIVIYIDPYAGDGYDCPADIILVTHEHSDHNKVSIVAKKPDTQIIHATDALKNGVYGSFIINGVKIESVEAYNSNHSKGECVGYILVMDKVVLYAAGDTSETEQMKNMKKYAIDWVFLPIDGIYNMDAAAASRCATLIGAKHTVPIHMKPGMLFDMAKAEAFHSPGRIIIKPGETIDL